MKLIDKDTVLAKIERLREELQNKVETSDFIAGEVFVMNYFLSFLDTLEVKEVDLEREIQAFAALYLEPLKISDSNIGISITMEQLCSCARSFFNLGLRASNPLTWEDMRKIDTLCCKVEMEHIPKE